MRPVPRVTDLRVNELSELMRAVQLVYKADALTIACQVSYKHFTHSLRPSPLVRFAL